MATLQERIFIDASASSTLMSGGAKEPGLGAWDGVRVIVECFPIPSSHGCPGETAQLPDSHGGGE